MEKIIPSFILYLTLFRLAIIAAGIVSIVLGYKLFVRGVWPDGGGGTEVDAKVGSSQFTLKNAAPGSVFALFGVIIIAVMFASGSPELTLKMLQEAGKAQTDSSHSTISELTLKSQYNGSIESLIWQGREKYRNGQIESATRDFEQAIEKSSIAINALAWLYLQNGEAKKALPLALVAVSADSNNADYQDTLAKIFEKIGETEKALYHREKAALLNPEKYNRR